MRTVLLARITALVTALVGAIRFRPRFSVDGPP